MSTRLTPRQRAAQTRYIRAHSAYMNTFDPTAAQSEEFDAATIEFKAAEEEAEQIPAAKGAES